MSGGDLQTQPRCPECGAAIDPDAPEGLCPRCLLRLARDLSILDPADQELASSLTPGDFADYELLAEIGHGGMGVVYQARQKSLDRIVALKMLLGGQFAEPQARARFRSEAEITAQLQHPNIVAIHEVGEHDHLPFFTMDYVEGRSLAEVAGDKPLTPTAAAGYLSIIARAIAYAHDHGVLHRDLKPSNILIDGSDQPRITDFGLAKRLTGSSTSLTLSGEALGSPNFMPPEQAAGKHKLIGPASDVYGLGAVLYYLVTSRPPFLADNLTAAVRQVQDLEPVSPRMLNPGVPKDIETICLKCLQKEPANRYQTAAELADELDRFRRGEPIQARPVGPVGRSWRWCRRRPALAALAAVVVALAVVSTTVAVRMTLAQEGRERERYRASIQLAAARIEEGSIEVALETLLACPERFRHWEWGYLVAQCHREVLTLEEARDATRSVAVEFDSRQGVWRCGFGMNGKRVGVVHPRGIVQVWELPSGKPLWSLREPLDREVGIVWLPDWSGVILARSNVVEVVRGTDPVQRLRLVGHTQIIRRLALSHDGRRVAAVAGDGSARVWEAVDGHEVSAFPVIPGVVGLFFTGDGTRLVVASTDEGAAYDIPTGRELTRMVGEAKHNMSVLPDPEGENYLTVSCPPGVDELRLRLRTPHGLVKELGVSRSVGYPNAVFSPDRSSFLTTGHGSTASVRDALTGSNRFAIPSRVIAGVFSPDGQRLATRDGTSLIHVWEPSSGREVLQLKGHTEPVHDVDFSHDGRLLASVSSHGTLKLWSALPGREVQRYPGLLWELVHTSDGRKVANAYLPDQIAVRDPHSGQWLAQLRRQRRTTTALAISPDDQHLASGDHFGEIAIWELGTGRLLRSWRAHDFFVSHIVFTPDGRFLLTSGGDGKLRHWDAAGTQELRSFEMATNSCIAPFDLSPDGRRLAAGFGKALRLWNLDTGRCERELAGHSELVERVSFTPDGKRVMTTAMDQTLRIWDAASGRSLASWRLSGDSFAFAISPDGKRVALRVSQGVGVGMGTPTMELWDAESGQQFLSYQGFIERDALIGFSPDGRRLVSAWWFSDLRQWEAFPWKVADYPKAPGGALRDRIELFARGYWQERLEAEQRIADTNSTVFVDLPYDRSRFPSRDPAAPVRLIDLTEHYTGILDECNYLHGNGDYSRTDLRHVPKGVVTFHDVPFDVRGVLQTACGQGGPVWGDYPESTGAIPVRQTCRRLHAIVGSVGSAAEGKLIGGVVLHYADGTEHELGILYGRHVRHWWTEGDPQTATDLSRVAWEGTHGYPAFYSTRLRIYHVVWDNPRPDQEIVSFDFVSKMTTTTAPFLLAVTLE